MAGNQAAGGTGPSARAFAESGVRSARLLPPASRYRPSFPLAVGGELLGGGIRALSLKMDFSSAGSPLDSEVLELSHRPPR